jgi:hypothetical protein
MLSSASIGDPKGSSASRLSKEARIPDDSEIVTSSEEIRDLTRFRTEWLLANASAR